MSNKYSIEEKKFLKDLGNHIRELRNNSGLSQEKLSFQSNLDRTYIGSIERGERNISTLNLRKISHALNIPINQLFEF